MAKALAAARAGFRRMFSISAFTPPPPATVPPPAEPSPNLFVSGLSKRTTSEGLREAFLKFGNIVQARVVTDRISGYSKGFGFVRYATTEEAAEGIKGMDGKFLDGWVIFAEYAKPRPSPSQGPSSQAPLNTSSAPQSNYTSHSSQSWSSYHSPQASDPLPSFSSYAAEESQNSSTYSSVSPSNYSSEISPSGYPQASQPPNYPPSSYASATPFNYPSQTSQPGDSSMQPSSHLHQTSEHASRYKSTPQNSEIPSGNRGPTKYQTSEPTSDFESGRAVNY